MHPLLSRGPLLALVAFLALLLASGPRAAVAATPCADLVVSSVGVTPAQPAQGQPATVGITVANNGTCSAGSFAVQWKPGLFSPPQPPVTVTSLGAGASTSVNVPFTFPNSGFFITVATVDPANAVAETNESNNTATKAISVSTGVDLAVSSLTISPAKPVAGVQANASVTVTNLGVNPAGGFRVDWTPYLGAAPLSRQVAGLGAGASTTLTIPYTYAASGFYASVATADAGGAISETNELNNSSALAVTVLAALPDLTVTNVSTSPNPAFAGSDVTATITVANVGVAPAGSFVVQWWPWLAATPVTTTVSGLGVGASTTVSLDSVFAFTGQFNGTVTVDPGNAVAEINELNNSAPSAVTAVPPTLNAQKIATGGFGDSQNSYAWSMAWFNGKLYVGTARSEHCVEMQTLAFYFPTQGWYDGPLDTNPAAYCPPDPYDLDLRAEIWQYTPGATPAAGTWARVYQSPADLPNPREPGKFVARDIGFRGMVVYNGALYAGGVSADEYIPELAQDHPPRILRTTDGQTWTPLATGPGIIHDATVGDQYPITFRAMEVFNGQLFVTASAGLTGDGVVLEVQNPDGPNPAYVQVTPNTMDVYEMATFNGTLYLGDGDPSASTGYSVWKLSDASTIPFKWTPVMTGGAGRPGITSVVSMHVFQGRLYIGANGWGSGSTPAAEEIRINPDDTWDLVAGAPRTLPDGTVKTPISGLGDGFGNAFNAHMWRAETYNGALYIGTNDASSAFQPVPGLGPALAPEFGFDVWGSCDGRYWWEVTRDAFGDGRWNFGARGLVASPFGLFVGSANQVEGLSVWLGSASPCGAQGAAQTNAPFKRVGSGGGTPAPAAGPRRLLAVGQPCGTALSWDALPGASRYRILRADYRSVELNVKLSQKLVAQAVPDLAPPPADPNAPKTQEVSVAGRYTVVGTTTDTTFVDHSAKAGRRYNYEIVAVSSAGQASQPSNVATVPSEDPAVAIGQLKSAVQRLADSTAGGHGARLLRLAAALQTTWQENPGTSLQALAQLRGELDATNVHGAAALTARSDVSDALYELERRAQLAAACK